MDLNYGVVIVSYYPSINLIELVNALYKYDNFVKIIIVDNTGEPNEIINNIISNYKFCEVIINKENMGIAYALNVGIEKFYSQFVDWVLTFDQDSLITGNLVEAYSNFLNRNIYKANEIGMIATNYYDRNTGMQYYANLSSFIEVKEAISSGALINIKIFMELGKYKDYYFIDQVDNEYCYRLKKYNKKIILLPEKLMEHSLGNITNAKFLWKKFFVYNQNPIRYYYRTRNTIFMIREYKEINLIIKKIKQLLIDFIKIFFEKNKKKKIYSYFRGLKEGILYNIKC